MSFSTRVLLAFHRHRSNLQKVSIPETNPTVMLIIIDGRIDFSEFSRSKHTNLGLVPIEEEKSCHLFFFSKR